MYAYDVIEPGDTRIMESANRIRLIRRSVAKRTRNAIVKHNVPVWVQGGASE